MHCPSCNAFNTDSNRFCESCGSGLAIACATCGYACGPGAKFCGGCGTVLARAATAITTRPPVAAWGELKQATVLFADIVSSTEQIAHLDPESAMDRLQPAITLMCDVVERFGGTIVRTLGDGVMAIFGMPNALERHASLACEAALSMQSAFTGGLQGFRIRVGLHSGQIASDPRAIDGGRGGGAHGVTIHLASRVMAIAEPGGVVLTADCQVLVGASFEAKSLGFHLLKGIVMPVEVFVLDGLRTGFSGQQFQQTALTAFRGRTGEMAALQRAQQLTESGSTQVVGISGAPGTGKSRLCYEFAQWSRARDIPVFEVRAQHYGNATPLQPVLELLRTFLFRIAPLDDIAQARRKIQDRLAGLGEDAQEDLPLLCEFLGLGADTAPNAPSSAKVRRARLLNIVRLLVRKLSAEPVVVLIEDLHWLDDASEEFVAALVTAVVGTKTLVVLNYRPSYRAPWIELPHFQQMELAELSSTDIDALVHDLISHRRELNEISRLVARRSGGNPFFAEELVRSLAESGALSGESGMADGGAESVERALPATVQAVIGARIDRLADAEKALLHTCAIIGKEIPLDILENVAGPMGADIAKGLDGLCHAELLQSHIAADGRHYSFRHPLIQEVAYGSQLKARRVFVHASVASAMELCYAAQIDERAGLIAHHYEAAGQALQAARYSGKAAQWLGGTDSAQAIKQWHKVRALLDGHEPSRDASQLRAMACSQISLLGWREGLSLEEVQPFIDEAMSLADQTDGQLVQLLLLVEGRMLQASGGPADWYVERAQQALAMARSGSDAGRIAMVNAVLSQAYGWAGLLEEALAANDASLADVDSIDRFDRDFVGFNVEHWLLALRSRLFARLGRFAEAQECLDRLFKIGQSSVDLVVLQIVYHCYVDLARFSADARLAGEHAGRISELDLKHSTPYLRAAALNCRGLARSVEGDHEAAIREFSEALSFVRSANVAREYETEILASLAECHRCVGDYVSALAFANEGIEISRQRSARLTECRAIITAGAALVQGRGVDSEAQAHEMFARAEELIRISGARVYESLLAEERGRIAGQAPRGASHPLRSVQAA